MEVIYSCRDLPVQALEQEEVAGRGKLLFADLEQMSEIQAHTFEV